MEMLLSPEADDMLEAAGCAPRPMKVVEYVRLASEGAWLVIEVAKSSLRRDRAKRGIYQRADVDEYWIVNHVDGCVEVYRDSRKGTWQSVTKHFRGETVSPLAFPDVQIPVAEILPPMQTG